MTAILGDFAWKWRICSRWIELYAYRAHFGSSDAVPFVADSYQLCTMHSNSWTWYLSRLNSVHLVKVLMKDELCCVNSTYVKGVWECWSFCSEKMTDAPQYYKYSVTISTPACRVWGMLCRLQLRGVCVVRVLLHNCWEYCAVYSTPLVWRMLTTSLMYVDDSPQLFELKVHSTNHASMHGSMLLCQASSVWKLFLYTRTHAAAAVIHYICPALCHSFDHNSTSLYS